MCAEISLDVRLKTQQNIWLPGLVHDVPNKVSGLHICQQEPDGLLKE